MTFPFRLCAAPLAGISNRAFREVTRQHGADLAYGEIISARALNYGNKKTYELMDIAGEEAPRIVQISGSQPNFVADAAHVAVSLGAQYIDLNMGCPVPKVVKNNEGCILMQQPDLAAELVAAAKSAGVPVSCKFRSGWDDTQKNAVEFACRMEKAGASFLAVHGRTRQQFYTGQADWTIIAAVKRAVSLPVIGNGDIFSAADALRMLEQTNCDGVMVGRGMQGNPWLFDEIKAVLIGCPFPSRPNAEEIALQALAQLRRHIERTVFWVCQREGNSVSSAALGENLAVRSMRGQLGWYTKGLRNSAALRRRLAEVTTYDTAARLFELYLQGTTA